MTDTTPEGDPSLSESLGRVLVRLETLAGTHRGSHAFNFNEAVVVMLDQLTDAVLDLRDRVAGLEEDTPTSNG